MLIGEDITDKYQYVRQKVLVTDQIEKQKKFYKSLGFITIHENGGTAFKFNK